MSKTLKTASLLSFILLVVVVTGFLIYTQLVNHKPKKNDTSTSSSPRTTTILPINLTTDAASSVDSTTQTLSFSNPDDELPPNHQDRTAAELATWKQWLQHFARNYSNNHNETIKRQGIFLNNLRWINYFNSNSKALYQLALNQFADLTQDEINNLFIGPLIQWVDTLRPLGDPSQFMISNAAGEDMSASRVAVDYRMTAGPILNQGTCRASSVYAAVANIESYYNLVNTSNQVRLSEKQVLDCLMLDDDANGGTKNACAGGISSVAVYGTLQRLSGGLCTAQNFEAYLNSLGQDLAQKPVCIVKQASSANSSAVIVEDEPRVKIASFGIVSKANLTDALGLMGPITVAIDGSKSTFHFYSSGLYHDDTCSPLNYSHHMLLVGHAPAVMIPATNTTVAQLASPEYYVMKNSFGANWGEAGYVRFLVDQVRNKCLPQGVATYPNLQMPGN